MKPTTTTLTLIFAIYATHTTNAQSISDMKWVTDAYAPYNYIEDGENKGSTVSILKRITNDYVKDINDKIEHKPWPDAYKEALNKENVGIFSLIKTKEREKLFQWVGPVGISQVHIITHIKNKIQTKEIDTLKYGVIKNDVGYQLLKEKFKQPNITFATNLKELTHLLNNNEVDAIAYEFNVFKHKISKLNLDKDNYTSLLKLSSTPIYIGISKQTSPEITRALQINLQKLKGIRPQ